MRACLASNNPLSLSQCRISNTGSLTTSDGGTAADEPTLDKTPSIDNTSQTSLAAGSKKNSKAVVTSISKPAAPSTSLAYPPGMVPMQPWPYQAPQASAQGQQRMMFSQPGFSGNPYVAQAKQSEPEKKPLQMYIVPKTLRAKGMSPSQSWNGAPSESQDKPKTRAEILDALDKVIKEEASSDLEGVSSAQLGGRRQISRDKSGKERDSESKLEQLRRAYKKSDIPKEPSRRPSAAGSAGDKDLLSQRSNNSKLSVGTDEEPGSVNAEEQRSRMEALREEDQPPSPVASASASASATARQAYLASQQEQDSVTVDSASNVDPPRMMELPRMVDSPRTVDSPRMVDSPITWKLPKTADLTRTGQFELVSKERDEEREAAEEWERQLQAERELLRKQQQQQMSSTDSSSQTDPVDADATMTGIIMATAAANAADEGVQVGLVAAQNEMGKAGEDMVVSEKKPSLADLMGISEERVADFAHSSHLILEQMLAARDTLAPKRSREVESFVASAISKEKDSPYNIALAAAALMKKQEPGQAVNLIDETRARHEAIADKITARLSSIA